MQVKELAELAGTTVRTVRHYHRTGLLPVPEVRGGRRDYDLRHVARLILIRWLAQAGVPLAKVAGMLDAHPDDGGAHPARAGDGEHATVGADHASMGVDRACVSIDHAAESVDHAAVTVDHATVSVDHATVTADLRATVAMLDAQLERLRGQRRQVARLLAASEDEQHLSPMPAVVLRFYEGLERQADDEGVRRAIRHERDFMELAYYRGDIPPEAVAAYETFDEARRAESLAVFGLMAERTGGASFTTEELEAISSAVVERAVRNLGPRFEPLARSIDLSLARRAADLYVQVGVGPERRRRRAVVDALLAAIEAARA